MRYFVQVGGREHTVTVATGPDGSLAVTVGGRAVAVESVPSGVREALVRVDGRVVDLVLEGGAPAPGVIASGRRAYLAVESERSRTASAAKPAGGGREREVRSPMPGRVVKVLVAEGDEVAAGQAVVIVEAMKMENELRAKKGGTVARVHAGAGTTVEAGAVLVSFA